MFFSSEMPRKGKKMWGEARGQRRHHTKVLHTRRHVYTSELQCNIKCRQTTTNERDQAADAFFFLLLAPLLMASPSTSRRVHFPKACFLKRNKHSHISRHFFYVYIVRNCIYSQVVVEKPLCISRMYMYLLFMSFHFPFSFLMT